MYVNHRGLIFLWLHILLHNLGQALKSCHSRSSRCTPSPAVTESISYFRCPKKGHYPIKDDTFKFYKCPGKDFLPCICTCKTSEMCFDSMQKRCRFAFLDSVKNCTHKLINHETGRKYGVLKPDPQNNDKELKHHKIKPDINEVIKPLIPVGTGPAGQNHTDAELLTEPEVIAAQQSANRPPAKVIEDKSRFPAWAISLLVLCVVLVLVFIVMVMY